MGLSSSPGTRSVEQDGLQLRSACLYFLSVGIRGMLDHWWGSFLFVCLFTKISVYNLRFTVYIIDRLYKIGKQIWYRFCFFKKNLLYQIVEVIFYGGKYYLWENWAMLRCTVIVTSLSQKIETKPEELYILMIVKCSWWLVPMCDPLRQSRVMHTVFLVPICPLSFW